MKARRNQERGLECTVGHGQGSKGGRRSRSRDARLGASGGAVHGGKKGVSSMNLGCLEREKEREVSHQQLHKHKRTEIASCMGTYTLLLFVSLKLEILSKEQRVREAMRNKVKNGTGPDEEGVEVAKVAKVLLALGCM